jgi:hypothetical protein
MARTDSSLLRAEDLELKFACIGKFPELSCRHPDAGPIPIETGIPQVLPAIVTAVYHREHTNVSGTTQTHANGCLSATGKRFIRPSIQRAWSCDFMRSDR